MASGVTDLTVAFVPTGMKAGVAISPCGVEITPARAAELAAGLLTISKENSLLGTETSNQRKVRY